MITILMYAVLAVSLVKTSHADLFSQGGKTYNKWVGYGQSKTANMLMALSLAKKLGVKYGLQAYSLHPGAIMTNLSSHLDWNVDMEGLCRLLLCLPYRVVTHFIQCPSTDN